MNSKKIYICLESITFELDIIEDKINIHHTWFGGTVSRNI